MYRPRETGSAPDPEESLDLLYRHLRSSPRGLTGTEAARRLVVEGPNVLVRRGGRRWPRQLAAQFVHPLAILLLGAAVLAGVTNGAVLASGIVAVVVVNAAFAFVQERHAERAVEALSAFLPERAEVLRDGRRIELEATNLVTGDVLLLQEGERVCADGRVVDGAVELDLSMLTGESSPVSRTAGPARRAATLIEAHDLVFSGTTVTAGEARVLVTATGMRTELGRISALAERSGTASSPLERQVRKVAWLISAVALLAGLAFLPAGVAAGMSWAAAASFAIGLIVANVPEGLLPTITLSLAIGVRDLATRHAVVKRLSAVETLGSTTVICTDKTGTLTCNRMQVSRVWTADYAGAPTVCTAAAREGLLALARAAAVCTTADSGAPASVPSGDPTELALLDLAAQLGVEMAGPERDETRCAVFHFDPARALMSTVDVDGDLLAVHVKGAPESVLRRTTSIATGRGVVRFDRARRGAVEEALDRFARAGLRVLAVACREVASLPAERDDAERELTLLGLVALVDPPRPGVADAVRDAHRAGVRIHVVTGDNGRTAAAIARGLGIGDENTPVVTGAEVDRMSDAELDELLAGGQEIVFARSAPETKLRVTDALRNRDEVVAVTGDGVNDAPALRRGDIGVAMGAAGTDVAREAATMVLTDDDFSTIVAAIAEGRRIYDNIRKFVVYIFAHAMPEVVPFLVFALSGGAIPLPLTVMQVLAIDLGTDLLPSLALGREAPEPGLMDRAPRPRSERLITGGMLVRAWVRLGMLAAALVIGAYLVVLYRAGWHPGASTGEGQPLHEAYRRATTTAWLGIVACQLGVAVAARTTTASLRSVGLFTNPRLLGAMAVSLGFAAALVYVPALQGVFGTASLPASDVALVAPFPVVVWGVDEMARALRRRRARRVDGNVGPSAGPSPLSPLTSAAER